MAISCSISGGGLWLLCVRCISGGKPKGREPSKGASEIILVLKVWNSGGNGKEGIQFGDLWKKELTRLDVSLIGSREKEDDLQVSSSKNDVSVKVYNFVFSKGHLFRRHIKLRYRINEVLYKLQFNSEFRKGIHASLSTLSWSHWHLMFSWGQKGQQILSLLRKDLEWASKTLSYSCVKPQYILIVP